MKNKKTFSKILIFLITSICVFAEVKLTEFSFAPEVGFLNGKIVENVWYVQTSITNNTMTFRPTTRMSRLDWQPENAFFFGTATELSFNDKYKFSFSFKNAITGDSGIMEDYDWLNPIFWPNDPEDETTNYSIHTNHLKNFTLVQFSLGRIFNLNKNKSIIITPHFGMQVNTFDFTGLDGWSTYKKNKWQKNYFTNKVISYSQNFIAPLLGFTANIHFLKYFEANIDLSTLYVYEIDCMDIHYLTKNTYNDRIENAWKFNAELGLFYKLNKNNRFGFRGTISYIPDSYGFTYPSSEATKPDTTTIGGTSRLLWTYSFVYKIIF